MWFWCFWTHRIRKCPIIDTIRIKTAYSISFSASAPLYSQVCNEQNVYATMYVTILRYVKPSILFSKVVLCFETCKTKYALV